MTAPTLGEAIDRLVASGCDTHITIRRDVANIMAVEVSVADPGSPRWRMAKIYLGSTSPGVAASDITRELDAIEKGDGS